MAVTHGPVAGVSDGQLARMIAIAGTPTAVVVIGPETRAAVVPLLAYIGAGEIALAGIRARDDAGKSAVSKPIRPIDIIESINDKYHLVIYRLVIEVGAAHRSGHTQSAVITCDDIAVVLHATLQVELQFSLFLHLLNIPFALVRTHIHHIIGRRSGWLQRVYRCLPTDGTVRVDRHLMHG